MSCEDDGQNEGTEETDLSLQSTLIAPACTQDGMEHFEVSFDASGAPLVIDHDSMQFQVAKVLGKGGEATVYGAREKTNGRQLALKVYSPKEFNWVGLRRAASVRNTVPLPREAMIRFEAPVDHYLPYVLLTYVDGVTLGQSLSSLHFAPRIAKIFGLLPSLLDTQRTLVNSSVVTQDLKPNNWMVHGDRVTWIDLDHLRRDGDDPSANFIGTMWNKPGELLKAAAQRDSFPPRVEHDLHVLGWQLFGLLPKAVRSSFAPELARFRRIRTFEDPAFPALFQAQMTGSLRRNLIDPMHVQRFLDRLDVPPRALEETRGQLRGILALARGFTDPSDEVKKGTLEEWVAILASDGSSVVTSTGLTGAL